MFCFLQDKMKALVLVTTLSKGGNSILNKKLS